jgi:hypothetical protein
MMEPLSEKVVEQTWQEVAGFSPQQATKEMQKMGKNQPELLAFLMAMTEDMEPGVKELAIYLAFVVYRIFESSRSRTRKLTSREIMSAYESNEALMGSLEDVHEKFIDRIAGMQNFKQPYVIEYVLDALFEETEDWDEVELTDEDRGFLFLLLKTEVDLLDKP